MRRWYPIIRAAVLAHVGASYFAAAAITLDAVYALRGMESGWTTLWRELGPQDLLAPLSVPVALVWLPYEFPHQIGTTALYWVEYLVPLILLYLFLRRRSHRTRRGFPVLPAGGGGQDEGRR